MKDIKEIILKNGYVIGSWINTASPIVAEIMAQCGLDFVVVDAEHSTADIEKALSLFQAINAGNTECIPMVRVPGNIYSETKRFLDAGAEGVIAPLINNKKDAEELVRSTKYPPLGLRGVGYGRSSGYGFNFDNYMKRANDNFTCVQIEHIDGVDNIDEIFSVDGVDAAFIGPYDLTASMGITAQFEHPKYIEAYNKTLLKCKEYNIIAGIHVVQPNPDEVVKMVKKGFQLIAYTLDITLIGHYYKQGLTEIRSKL
jgi:2-dehydro-3-deoxyglucarate aldolase